MGTNFLPRPRNRARRSLLNGALTSCGLLQRILRPSLSKKQFMPPSPTARCVGLDFPHLAMWATNISPSATDPEEEYSESAMGAANMTPSLTVAKRTPLDIFLDTALHR